MTHSHSSGEFDGYTGTTTAPAVLAARSAIVNSTRVLARIATRSPTPTPSSSEPEGKVANPIPQLVVGQLLPRTVARESGRRWRRRSDRRRVWPAWPSSARRPGQVQSSRRHGSGSSSSGSTSGGAEDEQLGGHWSRPATRLALTSIAVPCPSGPTAAIGSAQRFDAVEVGSDGDQLDALLGDAFGDRAVGCGRVVELGHQPDDGDAATGRDRHRAHRVRQPSMSGWRCRRRR